MRYRPLGRTGQYVSEICLGAMTFAGGAGIWRTIGSLDQVASTKLVGRALEAGVNFIDTANVYSEGQSEVQVGQALRDLGVKESRRVLELILDVKRRGLPIILISHNMPHVFEVADRIHIHRLGRRLTVVDPKQVTMSDAVAMMTGAMAPPVEAEAA